MVRVYCSRREGLGGPLLNAFMINVDELRERPGLSDEIDSSCPGNSASEAVSLLLTNFSKA